MKKQLGEHLDADRCDTLNTIQRNRQLSIGPGGAKGANQNRSRRAGANPHEGSLGQAGTLLLNPVTGMPLVDTFRIACLSYPEAMAEKLRAGLCRREVAIRDFFDIDHAVRNAGLNLQDAALLGLLRNKLAIDGTEPVDVSPRRLDHLRLQVDAQLRPVLRPREFEQFDLDRAFSIVAAVAESLG